MTRLIDADALKEELNKKGVVGRFNTLLLIDNAPTVESEIPQGDLISRSALKQMIPAPIEDEYKYVHKLIDSAPTVERPKATWGRTGQSFIDPNKFRNYFCSNCLYELDEHIRTKFNFCPNCGADMRKG